MVPRVKSKTDSIEEEYSRSVKLLSEKDSNVNLREISLEVSNQSSKVKKKQDNRMENQSLEVSNTKKSKVQNLIQKYKKL